MAYSKETLKDHMLFPIVLVANLGLVMGNAERLIADEIKRELAGGDGKQASVDGSRVADQFAELLASYRAAMGQGGLTATRAKALTEDFQSQAQALLDSIPGEQFAELPAESAAMLAQCAEHAQLPDVVVKLSRLAVARKPAKIEYYFPLLRCLINQNKIGEARDLTRELGVQFPESYDVAVFHYVLFRKLLAEEELTQAVVEFRSLKERLEAFLPTSNDAGRILRLALSDIREHAPTLRGEKATKDVLAEMLVAAQQVARLTASSLNHPDATSEQRIADRLTISRAHHLAVDVLYTQGEDPDDALVEWSAFLADALGDDSVAAMLACEVNDWLVAAESRGGIAPTLLAALNDFPIEKALSSRSPTLAGSTPIMAGLHAWVEDVLAERAALAAIVGKTIDLHSGPTWLVEEPSLPENNLAYELWYFYVPRPQRSGEAFKVVKWLDQEGIDDSGLRAYLMVLDAPQMYDSNKRRFVSATNATDAEKCAAVVKLMQALEVQVPYAFCSNRNSEQNLYKLTTDAIVITDGGGKVVFASNGSNVENFGAIERALAATNE